jgi:hypothetical protein
MAPRKNALKRKTSKPRRPVVTADYIGGNPPMLVSKEILADANWPHTEAGRATITNLDTAIIADLFRIPMWLLGYPYAPIARSAHQLKELAGPGPYHCNACGATYKFYHPPCKPAPTYVPADIKYVFQFDKPLTMEALEHIGNDLRASRIPAIVVDRPCNVIKL